jgi:oxaloacetate decarboxylase alpha subunit
MTYMKAVEAGVDIIDTAISPFAEGTSQPPTEPMVAAFMVTKYDTGLELKLLDEVAEYFMPIREKYIDSGLMDPKLMGVDINTLMYQVPGGMLSNLVSQLKQANAMDKFDEVLNEIPRVREDLGYPPLVTPTSQIVGTQAVLNVLMGERYKMVPNEVKMVVKGMYGKTTIPIKKEIVKKIIGDEEQITCRPADLILPEMDNIRKEAAKYMEQEEDALSMAMLPKPAVDFFKSREQKKYGIDLSLLNEEDCVYPV